MEFTATEMLTAEKCRRRYRILALKRHPDKNRREGAVEEFREMVEAHEFLLRGLAAEGVGGGSTDYKSLCMNFLQSVWGENREMNEIVVSILSKIAAISASIGGIDLEDALKPLVKKCVEPIPIKYLKKITEILERYHGVFHIGATVSNMLRGFVEEREEREQCKDRDPEEAIEIYPLLEDVWDGKVFRWTFAGKTFLVPLWHHEMIFDVPKEPPPTKEPPTIDTLDESKDESKNNYSDSHENDASGPSGAATATYREICIRCVPLLPSNMQIDAKNNIRVSLEFTLAEIFATDSIEFHIGEKRFHFLRDSLYMKPKQVLRLYGQGLPRANALNMLDISRRADIFVTVSIYL
jgi:hypothetical protein